MQTFNTPAAVSAVLDIPAGRIQVIAAERVDTTVDIRPADATRSRDVKAAQRIDVAYHDGALRIAAAPPENPILGNSGSVEVTVQLPAGSGIDAKTASADFRGVGRLGDVTFEGATGTVNLDETANAQLDLQSGGISVGRLGGTAQISTRKGDLHVGEAVTGTVTLHTDCGDISVGTARGTSASLNAGTAFGRIDNALANTAGSAASLIIHATTSQGDITARSL